MWSGASRAEPHEAVNGVRCHDQARGTSRATRPRDLCTPGKRRGSAEGPRIGLIVGKAVGSAVERHRVARRIRHIARGVLAELDPRDRVVIRALSGSRELPSARLEQELRSGLRRVRELTGPP